MALHSSSGNIDTSSSSKSLWQTLTFQLGQLGGRNVTNETTGPIKEGSTEGVRATPQSKGGGKATVSSKGVSLGKRGASTATLKRSAKRIRANERAKSRIKKQSESAASESLTKGALTGEQSLSDRGNSQSFDPSASAEVYVDLDDDDDDEFFEADTVGWDSDGNAITDAEGVTVVDGQVFHEASDQDLVDEFLVGLPKHVEEYNDQWRVVLGVGAEDDISEVCFLDDAIEAMTPATRLDPETRPDYKYKFEQACSIRWPALPGQVEGRTTLTDFGKAWQQIHGGFMEYFANVVSEIHKDDEDFKKAEAILEKRKDLLERISLIENDDEREAALAVFNEYDDLQFKWAYDVMYTKTKAYFDSFVETYYINDATYMESRAYIESKLGDVRKLKGEERDRAFGKIYREDEEFRDALEYVSAKKKGIMDLFGCTYREEDKITLAMSDIFPGLGKVKEHFEANKGKYTSAVMMTAAGIALPVAGLGAAGAMLAAPVGSVFAYKVGEKVTPTVQQAFAERGFYADVEAAKADREVRMPYLVKIFRSEVSLAEKFEGLKELHSNGLLYVEDFEDIDDEVRVAFFASLEDGGKELKSFEDFRTKREKLHVKLRDRRNTAQVKFEVLKTMHENGLMYRQDFDFSEVPTDTQTLFLAYLAENGQTLDDLFDSKAEGKLRQQVLANVKTSKYTLDQQLEALLELREKGMLFKQDISRIENPDLRVMFFDAVTLEDLAQKPLPDIVEFYQQEVGLMRVHDQIRGPWVGVLTDPQATDKEKAYALMVLGGANACFKEDLELVSESVRKEFFTNVERVRQAKTGEIFKHISEANFPAREDFYSRGGLGSSILRGAQVMGRLAMDAGGAVAADEANVAYGLFKGLKGVVEISAEAAEETFGAFTDVKTKALSERVASVMPGDQTLKRKAIWATNKTIGIAKWAAVGALVGAFLSGILGPLGLKLGAIIGGIYGACTADGNVRQLPAGGVIRALKFTGTGALVGAVTPVVAAFSIAAYMVGSAFASVVAVGLSAGLSSALAGSIISAFIAFGSALTVATVTVLPFIIPCIVLGIFAGYIIAGLTGKEEIPGYDYVVEDDLAYTPPSLELSMPLGSAV